MSTDFETLLRTRLHEETPDPPHGLDPAAPRLRARRDRRQFVAITAVVLCVLGIAIGLLVSQGGSHPTPPAKDPLSSIENVVWKDTQSTGTVVFHNGTMRLYDGCSAALHALSDSNGHISEGRQLGEASTCSPAVGADFGRLDKFYRVIRGPAAWSRQGSVLTLTRPAVGSVVLRTTGRRALALVGTTWQLVNYRRAGQTELYSGNAQLRISPNGSFVALGSCPQVFGTASHTATTITFLRLGQRVALSCTSVTAPLAVSRALRGRVTYSIRGDELLIDAGNRGFLAYRAVR